jgi:16S rRNA (uracil1498-N3)-methyltransferase
MHRFFSPQSDLNASQVTITDLSEIHHMRDVLRLKAGDPVTIFNGSGREAVGKILSAKDNAVTVDIQSLRETKPARTSRLILACAIPKKAKFEFIIEKCTELGVDEIIPMYTKRTEFKWEEERIQKKADRYKTVAVNAAKQSKRSTIPLIREVTKFDDLIANLPPNTLSFIPCLISDTKNLLEVFKVNKDTKNILFLIGPEGDFTPDEVQKAIQAGCLPVTLGKTILKVDTASICVVSLANLILS